MGTPWPLDQVGSSGQGPSSSSRARKNRRTEGGGAMALGFRVAHRELLGRRRPAVKGGSGAVKLPGSIFAEKSSNGDPWRRLLQEDRSSALTPMAASWCSSSSLQWLRRQPLAFWSFPSSSSSSSSTLLQLLTLLSFFCFPFCFSGSTWLRSNAQGGECLGGVGDAQGEI